MKEQAFVSVVIYTHNDADIIKDFLLNIDHKLHEIFNHYEIIIVNDASTDLTATVVKTTCEMLNGSITLISLSRKHGLEKAMMAGLMKSIGDFVYEIEFIGGGIESYIHTMYKTAMSGNDIVVLCPDTAASRSSTIFYHYINKVTYLNLDLKSESVRLVSRRALNAMLNLKEKVRYRKALYAYTGYKKESINYSLSKLSHKSKRSVRENIGTAFDIVVSFSNLGLKAAHYLSLIFFIFSIFMIAYSLFNYMFNQSVVEGWTTLMILISLGFAGLFFIVGMIGEYIARILIEIQDRPFYITTSVELLKPKAVQKNKVMREVAASGENL